MTRHAEFKGCAWRSHQREEEGIPTATLDYQLFHKLCVTSFDVTPQTLQDADTQIDLVIPPEAPPQSRNNPPAEGLDTGSPCWDIVISLPVQEGYKKQEEDGNKMTFDEENLFSCVADLFVAGTETTTSSLEWCLLYMLKFPEIQEKCHEEIDRVFGNKNCLEYEDRERMPYTQAVLQEVQRHASVVPLGVSHSPIRDVHLNGFFIPKGTVIITDLSSVHYDKTHWKYPHEFNPENFLNENGELIKTEAFLPFSAGPRVCLGENLARMEIFLFFTAMLQHFEFHWPDPTSPPDLRPVFGLSQAPKHYKMRIVSRKKK
eukprot:XP_017948672.1 PREDICTED: cytochrome P450 2U1-like [Xenopus tropicalis]